jgi:hypothetical protein
VTACGVEDGGPDADTTTAPARAGHLRQVVGEPPEPNSTSGSAATRASAPRWPKRNGARLAHEVVTSASVNGGTR